MLYNGHKWEDMRLATCVFVVGLCWWSAYTWAWRAAARPSTGCTVLLPPADAIDAFSREWRATAPGPRGCECRREEPLDGLPVQVFSWTPQPDTADASQWPLVVLSSARPQFYVSRLVDSLRRQERMTLHRRCFFAVHIQRASVPVFVGTLSAVLRARNVCALRIAVLLDSSTDNSHAARHFKRVWVALQDRVWRNDNAWLAIPPLPPDGSALFLDDDIELAPDAIAVAGTLLAARRSGRYPSAITVTLGGWGGENMIRPRWSDLVLRRTKNFPSLSYSLTPGLWTCLRDALVLHDRDLGSPAFTDDWAMAVSVHGFRHCWAGRPVDVLVPTLSRMYHVGRHGMGPGGDNAVVRDVAGAPPWSHVRQTTSNELFVAGVSLDVFGFACPALLDRDRSFCNEACANRKFPPGMRYYAVELPRTAC